MNADGNLCTTLGIVCISCRWTKRLADGSARCCIRALRSFCCPMASSVLKLRKKLRAKSESCILIGCLSLYFLQKQHRHLIGAIVFFLFPNWKKIISQLGKYFFPVRCFFAVCNAYRNLLRNILYKSNRNKEYHG